MSQNEPQMSQNEPKRAKSKKNYSCDFCNKLFNQESNLKKHVYAIHVGHKGFKCEFCGKLFSQKVNMSMVVE